MINLSKVQETTNYKQFKFIPENREIDRPFIENLKKAILERNLLEEYYIKVDKDFNVLDGQHRLIAAKELRLPIFFKIETNMDRDDLTVVNANQHRWSLENWVRYWAKKGNPNYEQLLQFHQEQQLSLTISAMLLTLNAGERFKRSGYSDNDSSTSHDTRSVRMGRFLVVDYDQAETFAYKLKQVMIYVEINSPTQELCRALQEIYLFPISHQELIEKLQSAPEKLQPRTKKNDWLREFELVLNRYRKKDPVRLF